MSAVQSKVAWQHCWGNCTACSVLAQWATTRWTLEASYDALEDDWSFYTRMGC